MLEAFRLPFIGLLILLFFLAGTDSAAAAGDYKKSKGPYEVSTLLEEWHDTKRDRTIPVKIYYAPEAKGERPIIIFSHGLGGSREAVPRLGEHMASYGYVCVHIQHPGSDESVWKGKKGNARQELAAATRDRQSTINRYIDPRFVIDELTRANASHAVLKNRLDISKIGMSGHSFGGHTTYATIGQKFGQRSLADTRIKAAIVYSPAPPNRGSAEAAFANIRVPVFGFTGTEDRNPADLGRGEMKPEDRQIPYEATKAPEQYLLVLKGADHGTFGGRQGRVVKSDAAFRDIVHMASIAFWDAYLLNDATAKNWLKEKSGLRSILAPGDLYKNK